MECHSCQRRLRWDETLELTWIEQPKETLPPLASGGTFCVTLAAPAPASNRQIYACPDCVAKANDRPPPPVRSYPLGTRPPQHPLKTDSGSHMPICGLCRVALPWGQESGQMLRIHPEMIDDEAVAKFGTIRPVAYPMCDACVAWWRPRSLAWLKRRCRTCETLDCDRNGHVRHQRAEAEECELVGDALF